MGEKNQIAGRWMCVEFFYVVDILYICRKLLSTCTFEIILVMFRWSKYNDICTNVKCYLLI